MKLFSVLLPYSLVCGVVLALSGCANYQLGDVKPSALVGINRIHVPPFRNDTLEPRLSSLVSNAVLKELQADGTYQVSNRANCDAVLVGTIREGRKSQLRAVRNNTLRSQELYVLLYVDYHLEDPNTGERINSTVPQGTGGKFDKTDGEKVYTVPQGRTYGNTIQFVDESFQVGERAAFALAAENMAQRLVANLCNGW